MQTYQHTSMQTCKPITMVIYIAGSIPLFKGKRSNHFRLQRQSKHGAFRRLKGQAAAPFPDKSSSRFAASVFIGKTFIRPPHAKEPLKTETTAPPPTDRKGKIRWGLRVSRRQGQPRPKGKRADGRHAAGYLRGKYRSLLGNLSEPQYCRIAENSPIRQGASPSAHPIGDGISPPSKIVRFIVSQARKERNIWVL